jgi:hypothetical protein
MRALFAVPCQSLLPNRNKKMWRGRAANGIRVYCLLLDTAKLVFIAETSLNTNMVRLDGRCPCGVRLVDHVPFGQMGDRASLPAYASKPHVGG